MEVSDVRDEDTNAEAELAAVELERILGRRLEEELREDEAQLEDDVEEEVVAAMSRETSDTQLRASGAPSELLEFFDGESAAGHFDAFAELEEPVTALTAKENLFGPDDDEFVCRSCFLVKRRTQLADPKSLLCADCAGTPKA